MTDEQSFQAALDAAPEDFLLRGVFADWLEEQGDDRCHWYRYAMEYGKRPWDDRMTASGLHEWTWFFRTEFDGFDDLWPELNVLAMGAVRIGRLRTWMAWPTRQEAEDAIAVSYAKFLEATAKK